MSPVIEEGEGDDDPFGAFGSDSDDDEDDEDYKQVSDNITSTAIAKSLVEAANQKIFQNVGDAGGDKECNNKIRGDENKLDLSCVQPLELPSWPQPLYKGPVLLVSSLPVGGGRGYVASETITSGTLVLVEEPMMKWPMEQQGNKWGIASVKHLLHEPNAIQLVQDMEEFHPTKDLVDSIIVDSQDCSGEDDEQVYKMLKELRLKFTTAPPSPLGESNEGSRNTHDDLEDLVELAKKRGIRSRNGSLLTTTDILRTLLALRYNGLESGVYRHVAMLNHDDYPNCAKLLPEGEKTYSEVRTTRQVAAGETLTISYLPRLMSHASRRRHLWDQHQFDIGVEHLKGEKYRMELVGSNDSLPPSPLQSEDGESETLMRRIETATEELERIQSEIADDFTVHYETAKALEQSALELYTSSVEELKNEEHILLIPILSLHIDACALVLKDPSLSNAIRLGVLSRQTISIYRLLPLQKMLFGPDHFDLGRANLDLANVINELLSRSVQRLCALNLPAMDTFAAWSTLEHKARKEYNRIKSLYPHDAETLLHKSNHYSSKDY